MAKSIDVVLRLDDGQFRRAAARAQRDIRGLGTAATLGGRSFGTFGAAVAGSVAPLVAAGAGVGALSGQFGQLGQGVQGLGSQFAVTIGNIRDFRPELGKVADANQRAAESAERARRDTGGFLSTIGKFVGIAAVIGGVAAAFQQLADAVRLGAEIEQIEITLSNLVGSAEGGARALQVITEAARELPFAFTDIASASTTLLTVSSNLQEFQDNIQLAADIAGAFGIPFETAVSGIQRAFSAGAASADIFRERGILAAAGFEAGVSYSVSETIDKFREFGAEIEGTSQTLNQSLGGAASQAGDAFDQLKIAFGEVINPVLTEFLLQITAILRQNKGEVTNFAIAFTEGMLSAFETVGTAVAFLIDIFRPIVNIFTTVLTNVSDLAGGFDRLAVGILAVVAAVKAFRVATEAAIVAGTVLQGVTGIGIIKVSAGVTAALAAATATIYAMNEAIEASSQEIGGPDGFFSTTAGFKDFFADLRAGVGDLGGVVGDVVVSVEPLEQVTVDIAQGAASARDAVDTVTDAVRQFKDDLDLAKGTLEEYNALQERLQELYNTGLIGLEEFIRLQRELDEVFGQNEGLNNFIDALSRANKSLSDDLATAFLEGQKAGDAFKSYIKTLITQVISDILRLQIIQPIIGGIFGINFGTGGGFGGFTGGGLFGMLGMGKGHAGGNLMANKPMLVGEKGPELFLPGQSGSLVPNAGLMGGTTININAIDTQSFKQALAKQDPEFIFALSQAGARRLPA